MNKEEIKSIKPELDFIKDSWQSIYVCSDQSEKMVAELGKVGASYDEEMRAEVLKAIDYSIELDKTIEQLFDCFGADNLSLFGKLNKRVYDVPYSEFRRMLENYISKYTEARRYYDLFYLGYDAALQRGYVKQQFHYYHEVKHA